MSLFLKKKKIHINSITQIFQACSQIDLEPVSTAMLQKNQSLHACFLLQLILRRVNNNLDLTRLLDLIRKLSQGIIGYRVLITSMPKTCSAPFSVHFRSVLPCLTLFFLVIFYFIFMSKKIAIQNPLIFITLALLAWATPKKIKLFNLILELRIIS